MTQWIPQWGANRIRTMVETRPDWCVSRPRNWGVPITAIRCCQCGSHAVTTPEVLYRQPTQPSLDGNTVDSQREHSAFAENAISDMTTLRFMTGRIQVLMKAISGQ